MAEDTNGGKKMGQTDRTTIADQAFQFAQQQKQSMQPKKKKRAGLGALARKKRCKGGKR